MLENGILLILCGLLVVFKEALRGFLFGLLCLDIECDSVPGCEFPQLKGDSLLDGAECVEHVEDLGLVVAGLETGDLVVGKEQVVRGFVKRGLV